MGTVQFPALLSPRDGDEKLMASWSAMTVSSDSHRNWTLCVSKRAHECLRRDQDEISAIIRTLGGSPKYSGHH
jgi:hypothetical protein